MTDLDAGGALTAVGRRAEELAWQIADAVADAWYRSIGPRQTEGLLGAAAAPLLWRLLYPQAPTDELKKACEKPESAAAWIKTVWDTAWIYRPDLVTVAYPIHSWLIDAEPRLQQAARSALAAAARSRIVTFADSYRQDADLLGHILQQIHTRAARSAGGVYHSPGEIGDLLARYDFEQRPPQPGNSIADEMAGSGGLARSAASWLREHDIDPASMRWYLNDVDEVASACAAANAMIWELGPNVLIGCVDILIDPDWQKAAAAQARESVAVRDEKLTAARHLAATEKARRLMFGYAS